MKKKNNNLKIFTFLFIFFLLFSSSVYASVFEGSFGSNEAGGDLVDNDFDTSPDTSSEPVYASQDPDIEALAIAAEAAGESAINAETAEAATNAAQAARSEALSSGASEEVAQEAAVAAAKVIIEGGSAVEAAQVASAITTTNTGDSDNPPAQDNGKSNAPPKSPEAADNRVKGNTAEEAAKGIAAKKNELVSDSTGGKKTLLQRIVEGAKSFVKNLNLIRLVVNIASGNFAAAAQQIINLGLTAASLLLPIPPGVTTIISQIVNQAFEFHNAFPDGVPPIPVSQLTPEAAEAIAEQLRADGNTVNVETEVVTNQYGETQTIVTNIVITGAGEGEARSTTVDINGVAHTVTISGDGTGVSVNPTNPSASTSSSNIGLHVLQPGWDYGSFNAQTNFCGNGVVQIPEQCELSEGLFDNPRCPQPVTCSGRLTGLVSPFGSCLESCQCIYDVPYEWAYVVGSCGATCNATIGCSTGQICSNGACNNVNLCGNGVVDTSQGEECDTGVGGGISITCQIGEICQSCQCVPAGPVCDNGVFEVGEECDINEPNSAHRSNPAVGGNVGICRAACEDCICSGGTSSYGHLGTPTSGQLGVSPSTTGEQCQIKNLDGSYDLARDENCDGFIDEGCACDIGDERICGERGGACGIGGTQKCINVGGQGRWDVCETNYAPQNEICDGIDNDCDLEVDECGCANFLYFNNASWEYYDGLNFIPISITSVNTTGYLTVDTNLSSGAIVNYTIYESDCATGSPFQTSCSQLVTRLNTTVNLNAVSGLRLAKVGWNITDQVIYDTRNNDGLLNRTFFFTANAGNQNISSGLLYVDLVHIINPVGSCNIEFVSGNGKLNANGIYFVNKSIEFNSTRSNDNGVNMVWNIEGQGESTITNSLKSFVMNFSRPGQKTITLSANIPGCAQQSKQISIMVIDNGPGLFTFINAPSYNQVFKLGTSGVDVNYRGNESYVVQSPGGLCPASLTCLAGNCPTTTSNVPNGCTGNNIGVTNSLTGDKFANLRFVWSKINRGIESPLKSGNGSDNSSGSINYQKALKSTNLGDKQIKLIANYTVGSTSLQGIFVRNFTVGTCVNAGRQRVNIDNLGRIINVSNTLTDRNACNDRGDGEGSCCPIGFSCDGGLCQNTGSLITSCSGYTDLDACENDPFSASEFEYNTKVQAGLPGECNVNYRCAWNQTACKFNITQTDNLGNFGGSCLESARDVDPDACANGEATKLVNITSTVSGELSCLTCQSGVFEVPCGRPSVELPFFGVWQLMISIISIFGLYLFLFRRRFVKD